MAINENLWLDTGGVYEYYPAKASIFRAGDTAHYYFQIVKGTVELNNFHEDGREFTLNVLSEEQCIVESLLSKDCKYSINAVARTDCKIIKLSKSRFLTLICENKEVMLDILCSLSDRFNYKNLMLFNNSALDPYTKIKTLMDYHKNCTHLSEKYDYEVPLTRQQIANMTGLRVETVIRTVKKMEHEKVIEIHEGQIFY